MTAGDAGVIHHDVGFGAAAEHRDRTGEQVALTVDVDDRMLRWGGNVGLGCRAGVGRVVPCVCVGLLRGTERRAGLGDGWGAVATNGGGVHAEAAGLQIRLRGEGDRERANQGVALFAGVRCG